MKCRRRRRRSFLGKAFWSLWAASCTSISLCRCRPILNILGHLAVLLADALVKLSFHAFVLLEQGLHLAEFCRIVALVHTSNQLAVIGADLWKILLYQWLFGLLGRLLSSASAPSAAGVLFGLFRCRKSTVAGS